MNIVHYGDPDDEQLYEESEDLAIEEQTEELINEVFNSKYHPVYDPTKTKHREEQYRRAKKQDNKRERTKRGAPVLYKQYKEEEVTPSFNQFLMRAQQKIDTHYAWLARERQKKVEKEEESLIQLTASRSSVQKLEPLYERCIELQRNRERKLQMKRIQKSRQEAEDADRFSFRPITNEGSRKPRQFKEYLAEKELWQKERKEQVERRRVETQVQKLSQCTFTPQLVAKYKKPIRTMLPGERVQERLLRSLQKSMASSLQKLVGMGESRENRGSRGQRLKQK